MELRSAQHYKYEKYAIQSLSSGVALRNFSEVGHNLHMHYVYILSDAAERVYIGYSSDLRQRLQNHKYKNVRTTSTYEEPKLVWYCAFASKKKALDFEKYLKAGSGHAFMKKHLI